MEAGTGSHAQLPGQAGHDQCVLAGHAVWCFRWREAGPVSVPAVHQYGPCTLYDLDALPEDGERYELADGWLTELSPSPWHDHAAGRRKEVLKNAARLAGAAVNVAGGPNDITTPAGARKPDAFIVPRDIARTAIGGQVRTCYAGDPPLAAEVNSPAAAASRSAASAKPASTPGPGSPTTGSRTSNPKPRPPSSPSTAESTPWTPRYAPGMRSPPASHTPSAPAPAHSPNSNSTSWPSSRVPARTADQPCPASARDTREPAAQTATTESNGCGAALRNLCMPNADSVLAAPAA